MSEPTAQTAYGTVRGFWQHGAAAFRGVPYAAAPVGPLRFRPPVPPAAWAGVRDGTRFGQMAPQYGPMHWENPVIGPYMTGGRGQELTAAGIERGEDCLHLNVLAPRIGQGPALPVMVYLHGCGYGACSPFVATLADRLVTEQDVLLVSVGHRLNMFGFLYLGEFDERYRESNVGLLDLVLALRWVRDNAAAFGGDPDRVTVFGESGGGWKVLDLMGMPQARGLFHRAIVESAPWPERLDRDEAAGQADRLLARAGIRTVQELEAAPTAALVDAMRTAGPLQFHPVIDGVTLPGRTWLDRAPTEAAGVPLLIGNCRDEMTALADDDALLEVGWDDVVPELHQRLGLDAGMLAAVVELYRARRPRASAADVLIGIWSDRLFGTAAAHMARWHSAQAATYRYHFAYPVLGRYGAFHTAELPLALRLVCDPETEDLSRRLSVAWAGFARDGIPAGPGLPLWEPCRPGLAPAMVFGAGTDLVRDLHADELAAVSALPPVTTAQGR